MHIICQWQVYGPDMHPEFAPEYICYEDCREVATTRVTGHDAFDVDVFVCDAHVAPCLDGLRDGATEPIEAMYARGYSTGAAEADLAELTFDQAQYLLHEDEWPEELAPRNPVSGEWADDIIVLDDDAAEQYELGFIRGWTDRLGVRAEEIVRLGHPAV